MKFILLASMLVLSMSAFAKTKSVPNPEIMFVALWQNFSGAAEVNGSETKIQLKSLVCSHSLSASNRWNYSKCTAVTKNNKTLDANVYPELLLDFATIGANIDRRSEPGTTYVSFNNLNCSMVQSPNSINDEDATYSCTAN